MEWIDFDEGIGDSTSGSHKIAKSDYLQEGILPIIDQGRTFIAGYSNQLEKRYSGKLPCIVFGDHTRSFKYVDFSFALGADGTKVLTAKKDFNTKYLYYYLRTIQLPEDLGYSRHFKYLKNIKLPLQSLQKQNDIVNVLDRNEFIIFKRQQTIHLADELIRATFYDMFGDPFVNNRKWEILPLSQMIEIENEIVKPEDITNGEIYVGLENIEKDTGKLVGVKQVDVGELGSAKFRFTKEQILYGKLRPYLNKVATPDFDGICSTDIFPITPRYDLVSREFMASCFRHRAFVNYTSSQAVGANLPRVNSTIIKGYECIRPPLKSQQIYSELIQKIELQMKNYNESLHKMEELNSSLLSKCFEYR